MVRRSNSRHDRTYSDDRGCAVVSLLIVNSDGFSATDYDMVFKAVGLDALSYTPTSAVTTNTAWPSLGSMIDSGKRLVTFMDHHADFTAVPYIIDGGFYCLHLLLSDSSLMYVTLEFTNVWETAYDVTDTMFNCNVDQSNGDTATELYLINHFCKDSRAKQWTVDGTTAGESTDIVVWYLWYMLYTDCVTIQSTRERALIRISRPWGPCVVEPCLPARSAYSSYLFTPLQTGANPISVV